MEHVKFQIYYEMKEPDLVKHKVSAYDENGETCRSVYYDFNIEVSPDRSVGSSCRDCCEIRTHKVKASASIPAPELSGENDLGQNRLCIRKPPVHSLEPD